MGRMGHISALGSLALKQLNKTIALIVIIAIIILV